MRNTESAYSREIKSAIKARIKGKISIVGIGNIIRGDDGLGPKLIELLKARPACAPP